MHEKRSTRFLVLTRAGGNHLGGQGDNWPHIPKKLSELPPAFLTLYQLTTLGIYHEEKTKKQES